MLSKFYGLAGNWTLRGLSGFLQRLLLDKQLTDACGAWIWSVSDEQNFAHLLYGIGFLGYKENIGKGKAKRLTTFRSLGPTDSTPPPIRTSTDLVVHPSYWQALDLQDVLIQDFTEASAFGVRGLQFDLPESLEFDAYLDSLRELLVRLKSVPDGVAPASTEFESCVGEALKLCFFRSLANVEEQVRDVDGVIRRDWVVANRGSGGFWEMLRQRYNATQIIVECKNYAELSASDFQQANYYMSSAAGRVVIIVFKGEIKNHYFEHVRRVSAKEDGLILLLSSKDLQVFVRQAINGKVKEDHLLDRYDRTVRAIS